MKRFTKKQFVNLVVDELRAIESGELTPDQWSALCTHILCRGFFGRNSYSWERGSWGNETSLSSVFEVCQRLEGIFQTWEKYSGYDLYPVPGPDPESRHSARWAYLNVSVSPQPSASMYKGEYGKLRRELAGHIADELERMAL